ncbi:hypothetical protein Slala03_06830 [Streptomyces lavendulae subsp. lavendulae]|nr:hypothetical protein Slala03_06830 [Streptomyces lavendulae subsp. lavendulae]
MRKGFRGALQNHESDAHEENHDHGGHDRSDGSLAAYDQRADHGGYCAGYSCGHGDFQEGSDVI